MRVSTVSARGKGYFILERYRSRR